MRTFGGVLFTLLLGSSGWSLSGWAAEQSHEHSGAHHGATMASEPSCHTPVQVTEAAERKPGGALYAGAEMEHHSGHSRAMPGMEGAHMTHESQRGGTFFMAPNKMHHLEGVYSDDCGFQLYLFNAFTEHIHVDRFQAFVHVYPSKEDELDIIRFLSPANEGTVLTADFGGAVSRPFQVDLYVKFPESAEPQLFNILVPAP